jgi:hypothetical protein
MKINCVLTGACMKHKTQKTNFISKTKCLGIFIFINPLLAIYRENKSGADYVQGEENREAQLKIIKTTFTNLVVRTMCSQKPRNSPAKTPGLHFTQCEYQCTILLFTREAINQSRDHLSTKQSKLARL